MYLHQPNNALANYTSTDHTNKLLTASKSNFISTFLIIYQFFSQKDQTGQPLQLEFKDFSEYQQLYFFPKADYFMTRSLSMLFCMFLTVTFELSLLNTEIHPSEKVSIVQQI